MNRRTLLSSTVPAIGALGAAVLVASPAAAEHPDALLLMLDDQAAALYPMCQDLSGKCSEAQDILFDEILARGQTLNDASAQIVERLRHLEDPTQEAWDRFNTLERDIRELPAATVAGLAVKARMIRRVCSLADDTQGPEEDWDWDKSCLELFLREVERLAGEA